MKCPACGCEMRAGRSSFATRIDLKWLDNAHINDERLFLPYRHLLCGGEGETVFYCPDCQVVAMMAEERASTMRKITDKLKDFTEKVADEREKRDRERRETQRHRFREKRRKKDPWED